MYAALSYLKTWWASRGAKAPVAAVPLSAEHEPEEQVRGAVVQVIMVFDTPLPDSVAAQICQSRGAQIEDMLQDDPHLVLTDPRLDNTTLSMRTTLYARALSDAEVDEFHERRKK